MKRLRGCLITLAVVIVVFGLACGILAETTTPLALWLTQHNYYFADLVNFLHGHH